MDSMKRKWYILGITNSYVCWVLYPLVKCKIKKLLLPMSMLLPQVLSQKKHLKFHLKIILKRSLQLTTLWHYLI